MNKRSIFALTIRAGGFLPIDVNQWEKEKEKASDAHAA